MRFHVPFYDTLSVASPKLSLIDYLVQLGSILVFWFGLSIFAISNEIIKSIQLIYQKCPNKNIKIMIQQFYLFNTVKPLN